jgi:hypothetical protein
MKTASAGLKAHLAQSYQTLATCWKVTLKDTTVKAFTDHDQNIVFDGDTYLAASGYTPSSIETTDALNVDNLEVVGMLVSPSITEDDLRAGLWDFARVEVFLVNWADLTQGRLIQRVGTLGEVSADTGQRFKAELRGLAQAFTRTIGRLTSPLCSASLGDSRCQVGLGPFTVTGTLTDVNPDNQTLFDTGRTEPGPAGGYTIYSITAAGTRAHIVLTTTGDIVALPAGFPVTLSGIVGPALLNGLHILQDPNTGSVSSDFYIDVDITDTAVYPAYTGGGTATLLGDDSGYFDFGVLTFTSGANDGLSMEVRQYTEGQITLALPMPYECQIGDTYSLIAGCDKTMRACGDKFSNVVNFRGFPHVPGNDKAVQVGRRG